MRGETVPRLFDLSYGLLHLFFPSTTELLPFPDGIIAWDPKKINANTGRPTMVGAAGQEVSQGLAGVGRTIEESFDPLSCFPMLAIVLER